MTWHLKDRELEKKLIEIAPDFVESLNESLKLGEYEENSRTYEILFGPYEGCYKFEMHVFDEELEEVPEYNPKAWNEYPAVKPPEGEMMRVEYFSLILRKLGRTCAIFCNGQWFVEIDGEPDTEFPLEETMIKVKRFRPWED